MSEEDSSAADNNQTPTALNFTALNLPALITPERYSPPGTGRMTRKGSSEQKKPGKIMPWRQERTARKADWKRRRKPSRLLASFRRCVPKLKSKTKFKSKTLAVRLSAFADTRRSKRKARFRLMLKRAHDFKKNVLLRRRL